MPGTVMHAVDLLDAETVHQPVLDHRGGTRAALFGRLEDHDRVAGEIPGFGEITGRTQQHRGMAVMAAGVHQARRLGGIRQVGFLLDRQRVHVGAQPDHLDVALAGRLLALDDADDAGLAEPGGDLVAAELPQAIRHECCSAVHFIQQFGIFMDIAAPGLNIGLQIGDAVDDGHRISQPRLECSGLCSMQAANHPTAPGRPSPAATAGLARTTSAPVNGLTRPACSRPA